MSIQTYSGWKQNFIANDFKILFILEYLVRNRLFFLFKRLCTFMLRNHRIASCPIIHVNVYIYIPLQIWHYYKNSLRKCVVHFDRNFGCYPHTYETDMGLDIFSSSRYLYFWLDIYLRVIAHDLSSLWCLTKHLFQSIFL